MDAFLGFLADFSGSAMLALVTNKLLPRTSAQWGTAAYLSNRGRADRGAWIQFKFRYYMFRALVFCDLSRVGDVFLYPWAVGLQPSSALLAFIEALFFHSPSGWVALAYAWRQRRPRIGANGSTTA